MKIAFIGLGEVGCALAEDLSATAEHNLSAWDTAFGLADSVASRNVRSLNAAAPRVRIGADGADAVSEAELVISAVTAANAFAVAQELAAPLRAGAWLVDLNSASPGQKQRAAAAVHAGAGRYVEAAVMSPIHPKRSAAPILLGGPHARAVEPLLRSLGFADAQFFAETVGPASATKLCRSVVVKGLEALVTEALLAARAWGVEAAVLSSLSNLASTDDWEELARYLIGRSLQHGTRRAEEMIEATATVADTGVEPLMATATAKRQDWAAQHVGALEHSELVGMLDAIRGGLAPATFEAES
jgi:3-hydroxyisobutyrate dehydrogenase-like beta-hydroxyacid dehydrogenase